MNRAPFLLACAAAIALIAAAYANSLDNSFHFDDSHVIESNLYLRSLGNIAIVLVEQYLDFACELGDQFAVMDRGAVTFTCDRANLDPSAISRAMAL